MGEIFKSGIPFPQRSLLSWIFRNPSGLTEGHRPVPLHRLRDQERGKFSPGFRRSPE